MVWPGERTHINKHTNKQNRSFQNWVLYRVLRNWCPLLSPAILFVDCYEQKNHFSYLLENLNTATTWKITGDFVLSQIFWCHKYWYLQIADIPPNSCLYIEGNFTQTKTPLTTILIIEAHKARKQIIPQSNLKFSMFKYRFLFHNRMYGKSRHLITG